MKIKVEFNVIFIGLLSFFFACLKFSRCVTSNFAGDIVTSRGCYSDIPIFWNTHLLEAHLWPYKFFPIPEVNEVINPVEYPFLTGFLMWIVSFITPSADQYGVNFFKINALLIGIVFLICLNLINKIKKSRHLYFATAPAVVFSLFINWDIWAVTSMLAAIYLFDKERHKISSFLLAISISFKFFPIVLFIPIIILGIRKNNFKKVKIYIVNSFFYFAVINFPAAFYDFEGWFYFYKSSFQRSYGSGSIWEILNLSGVGLESINSIFIASTLLVFSLFAIYVYKFEGKAKLANISFYFIFAFTIFNKVYSPQYVIWLTSLGILALHNKKQKIAFAIWQFTELVYHFAIWRYLYWQGYGLNSSGLDSDGYMWSSIARYISLIIFAISLIYPQLKNEVRNQIH